MSDMIEMEYGNTSQQILAEGSYRGMRYQVRNCRGMHPCGYVEVSGTSLNGKDYLDLDWVDCHGGLTFSNSISGDGWWIGWDYGHGGDYCAYEWDYMRDGQQYTTQEVVDECQRVIDQIISNEEGK